MSPSEKSDANSHAVKQLQTLSQNSVTRALMGNPEFYGQIQLTLQFTNGVATEIFTDTRQTHKLQTAGL